MDREEFDYAVKNGSFELIWTSFADLQRQVCKLSTAECSCSVIDGRVYLCSSCVTRLVGKSELLDRILTKAAIALGYSDEINCLPWDWLYHRAVAVAVAEAQVRQLAVEVGYHEDDPRTPHHWMYGEIVRLREGQNGPKRNTSTSA
jgi:hypothetical protein